jgi:N-methylhydantoinase A
VPARSQIVGVDVGGTFTDLLLLNPAAPASSLRVAKVPTTPTNQAQGVLAALAEAEADPAAIGTVIHGTTTTTNALLERKLARTGLVTTAGFRDVLELGRRTRPHPYGMTGSFEPLISRELRLGVGERMDYAGRVLVPLDEAEVEEAGRRLLAAGCEAVVVHFLHAYANPAHELAALAVLQRFWPNGYITLGHRVSPEPREFERGTTAAVNASVQPVLDRYVRRLGDALAAQGFGSELLVMLGNGGTVTARHVAAEAAKTVMSGPASGVIAAAWLGAAVGYRNLITYDMGGTSTDVALISGGAPALTDELELEYAMPIHVPMVDVQTIGAGGGSIARIDEGGLLRVGPESAGADPGPIGYGRGGASPTITDADLMLGRLDPKGLLAVKQGGGLDIIETAIRERIGAPLGLDATAAAAAIIRVAHDRMAGAIRMVSLARGHDPRDYALFAFGGAGPLHAAALARELGIPTVLIPPRPGLTNAFGCIVADLRQDLSHAVNLPVDQLTPETIIEVLRQQADAGRAAILRQGIAVEDVSVLHTADMQFRGQTHLLNVPVPADARTPAGMRAAFEAAFLARFGIELAEMAAMLVNLRTTVLGRRPALDPAILIAGSTPAASLPEAQVGEREVWFEGGRRRTPVYRRQRLPSEAVIEGPAIITQLDTTVVLDPGSRARLHASGTLIVDLG